MHAARGTLVGLMLLQPDGSVAWANELAAALLGEGPVREGDPGWRALHGQAVHGERRRVDDETGRPLVVDVTAVPIGSAFGGALVIVSDATERDRLERADAEFVENAAHQLRSPVTAIVASIAALEGGARDDPAESERFLAHVGRESRRMAAIVEGLLSLASVQRGTGRPLIELLPLRLLVDEAVARAGVDAEIDCPPEIAVVAERELLAQALVNVLSNAARHAGSEGIRIGASLDGATVLMDVTDSGPGIPGDDRDRIFERFYRSPASRGPGSGLGLAIARTATEGTRGTLELLPQREGEGATFRFTLPGARLL